MPTQLFKKRLDKIIISNPNITAIYIQPKEFDIEEDCVYYLDGDLYYLTGLELELDNASEFRYFYDSHTGNDYLFYPSNPNSPV